MNNYAWAINLARHVEPRLVSGNRVVALMLIGFCVAFVLALPLFAGSP